MSKAIMMSVRPKWCEKICRGEKTIEVRKTRPKLDAPFKCYIYCTQSGVALGAWGKHGKVVGEFTCDRIYELETRSPGGSYYVKGEDQPTTNDVARQSCLTLKEMHEYLQSATGYGWHISDLVIYDEPKKMDDFTGLRETKFGLEPVTIKRPPQSWCYVDGGDGDAF